MDYRFLRSGIELGLLGNRQSVARPSTVIFVPAIIFIPVP